MMISKLTTLGVVGGLLAGLMLGTVLAAVFSVNPPAMAQPQTPPACWHRLRQSSRTPTKPWRRNN